jgi:hypothetical protein
MSEPAGQNVFDQGHLFTKINPTIGYLVEYDASLSVPAAVAGGARAEMTRHSDLLSYTLMP